jgi:hypothetical protein
MHEVLQDQQISRQIVLLQLARHPALTGTVTGPGTALHLAGRPPHTDRRLSHPRVTAGAKVMYKKQTVRAQPTNIPAGSIQA